MHGASAVGGMLEGGGAVPAMEGIVGVEVWELDGALQHCANSCTWGLADYIIGGRPVLVGVSHYSDLESCIDLLNMGHSGICHKSIEGAGEFYLKNEANRITGGVS